MKTKPDLNIGVQGVEIGLTVVAKSVEVVEQSAASMTVAELQVVANAGSQAEIAAVVPPRLGECCLVGRLGLIYIVDHLVACRCLGEAAGLRLVAGSFLLALIAIEDPQREIHLEPA